jgi:MFS family permease
MEGGRLVVSTKRVNARRVAKKAKRALWPAMPDPAIDPPSARALWRERDYPRFWASRFMGSLGSQIQSVTMGWQVYDISRRTLGVEQSAFNVSLIGLITFGPLIVLALPAGESADRYDRRRVLLMCYAGETTAVAALAWIALNHMATPPLLFALAFLFGTSRAFFGPAMTALAPMMVSRNLLPRAIVWNSLAGQSASIAGPAIAGLLIAISPGAAYLATAVLYLGAVAALISIGGNTKPQVQPGSRLALVREGLAYVWANKVVLGAISLDLAAVILGGATALLPAFAKDVLHVGAQGFGILRAGPALGASAVGLYLASHPIRSKAGVKMLVAVGVFGAATVVFGLSKSLWLSVAALAVLGGADMLSVFVRQTLVQLVTPDPMRGRVGAVSGVFIGASNELGEFESGVAARFLGPVGAAVFGGVGALIVTAAWAKLFPALREADRLE